MTIEAKILADSISTAGVRLTTFQLKYPRFIHAEFMTHRVFGRNASSSRAVPVKIMIRNILADPAEPVAWGSNKPGMQAGKELTGWRRWAARRGWHLAKHGAILGARLAVLAGAHKQVANRILEPWGHISVVVTATEWDNFYDLRTHPDADPTFQALAKLMQKRHRKSVPQLLKSGQWHLPYANTSRERSAARCARVSYLNHQGFESTFSQDMKLFDQLAGGEPIHASPLEHQARPDSENLFPELHGNLRGWIQFRKEFELIKESE